MKKLSKEMDYNFQQQQIQRQQDFELQLEKYKISSNFDSDLNKIKIEKQKEAFNRLMAIKLPLAQSITTNLEAKLLSEYYERRFQLFTNDSKDFEEAKYQNERGINLIKDISNSQKELFEILGSIQTNFIVDKKLETAISDLYHFQSIDVSPFPNNFKNVEELNIFFEKQSKLIAPLVKNEYSNKIETILNVLKPKISQK